MREVNVEGRFASLEGSRRRLGLMQPWGFNNVEIGNSVKASFGFAFPLDAEIRNTITTNGEYFRKLVRKPRYLSGPMQCIIVED
jgi:hypothetical protein